MCTTDVEANFVKMVKDNGFNQVSVNNEKVTEVDFVENLEKVKPKNENEVQAIEEKEVLKAVSFPILGLVPDSD